MAWPPALSSFTWLGYLLKGFCIIKKQDENFAMATHHSDLWSFGHGLDISTTVEGSLWKVA